MIAGLRGEKKMPILIEVIRQMCELTPTLPLLNRQNIHIIADEKGSGRVLEVCKQHHRLRGKKSALGDHLKTEEKRGELFRT